ncbi:MAG TPA: glutaredoxin family protein [Spirochaetota bacterium]|nr:glutaredoxin family protein [Spirochaetota bacterium]HRX46462.1 glutaredoxin family protein [Spirochaetota bacterium]
MDNIKFIAESGNKNLGEIKVYALSTCAFCKKALKYLRENSITFMYIYVDDMEPEEKQTLKDKLRDRYKRDVGFPFMVINEDQVVVGFKEDEYKTLFTGE